MRPFVLFLAALVLLAVRPGLAAEPDLQVLTQQIQNLTESIQTLQLTVESQKSVIERQGMRLASLEKGSPAPSRLAAERVSMPEGVPNVAGLSQGFNPDIGVAGTVQGNLTNHSDDGEGQDTIALKELEVSFAQYVDPYSRLDVILALNDNLEEQNIDIEEAYYTRWGLPLGFTGQIGKFRSKFGKQNLLHLHALPTVDYPLVIQEFFGDEGLSSSGARLQNMVPNPWDIPLEITGEILRGNNGNSFSGISRTPIFNTHIKSYFEVTKDVGLELGSSAMFGDENVRSVQVDESGNVNDLAARGGNRYGVHVLGADATVVWHLPEGRVLKFQNEFMLQARDTLIHPNGNPWGFYSLVDYRLSRQWSVGMRFDYLQPLDVATEHIQTTAISPYITFWQSEFANFQLQWTHTNPASSDEKPDDALYFRVNFLIGAHRHVVQ